MLKLLSSAAIAAFLVTGVASAATFNVVDSSPQGGANTAGLTYAVGYGANTPADASFDVDPTVPAGNITNVAQSPFNSNALTGTQDYFSVGQDGSGNGVPSPVTLSFDFVQDDFDILWGSIDSYNTISFSLSTGGPGDVYTVTGNDVAAELGLSGATNYEQVALLSFGKFENGFDTVTFSSGQAAFEFALAAVPLPAAGLLLLGALGVMGAARRRKTAA